LEQHCQNGMVFTYSGYEKDGKTVTQGGYSTKIVVDERFALKVSPTLAPEKAGPRQPAARCARLCAHHG
jgi:uncharacterized zinc-type alcohol dehydrogenase-like protein